MKSKNNFSCEDVEAVDMKKVTKFGAGAHVIVLKEYIGRNVYIVVPKNGNETYVPFICKTCGKLKAWRSRDDIRTAYDTRTRPRYYCSCSGVFEDFLTKQEKWLKAADRYHRKHLFHRPPGTLKK